jgi:quercetin dioxygenase-like cupin family protein
MRLSVVLFAATLCLAPLLSAQDAVKVDPKHYTVVSENDEVRILRAHYGPHEKSVMHSHPAGVAVFLTDVKGRFTLADGKTEMMTRKAGDALYTPNVTHLPENDSDHAMDVIVIEFKKK